MSLENWVKSSFVWFGQACLSIKSAGKYIYFDPHKVSSSDPKADFIFITHKHFVNNTSLLTILDECGKIVKEDTIFICTPDVAKEVSAEFKNKVVSVTSKDDQKVGDFPFTTIPSYNLKRKNHPKSNNWVGFIVSVEGKKVYHAGDTNRIPEMKGINVDIAMLPLGQTYTMESVEEAVDAAVDTGCKLAIPIHFGFYEGKKEDGPKFVNLCSKKNIKALVMDLKK